VKLKSLVMMMLVASVFAFTACGGGEEEAVATESVVETEETEVVEPPKYVTNEDAPEGKIVSELTGEFIDEELENQRPIAVMIDNESIALPHYGVSEADIVYEMVNSTKNERITRLMVLVKDWENIKQLGNVRSARPTNFMLCMGWNAILCHDGGPVYNDNYSGFDFSTNLSGGFDRVPNGKAREFTEYITEEDDIKARLKAKKKPAEYQTEYYEGPRFMWLEEVDLGEDAQEVTYIAPPFPHNQSELTYNEEDQLYYYSEYGDPHLDPGNDDAQLCFKNVVLQKADMYEYDKNGYMYYEIIGVRNDGYYIVNGKAIPIEWVKPTATSPTKYYDLDGNEVALNVGKTYIAIVPSDTWEDVIME